MEAIRQLPHHWDRLYILFIQKTFVSAAAFTALGQIELQKEN